MSVPSLCCLVFVLSIIQFPYLTYAIFWGLYPSCAISYLNASAPTSCAQAVQQSQAPCLCASKPFLTNAAKAIGAHCGCDTLNTSANVAGTICGDYGYYMAIDADAMIAAGKPCNHTETSPSSTPRTPGHGGNGLSTSSKISIGAGVGGGVIGLAGVTIAYLAYRSTKAYQKAQHKAERVTLQLDQANAVQQVQRQPVAHAAQQAQQPNSTSAAQQPQQAQQSSSTSTMQQAGQPP